MAHSFVYVLNVHGLELPVEADGGFFLLPGLRLTNDFREIEPNLDGAFFKAIGTLESSALRESRAVAYAFEDATSVQNAKLTPHDFILRAAAMISVLFQGLWLVKDHSAYPDLGFVQVRDGEEVWVHSNQLSSTFTTATGERSTITLTLQELRRASEFVTLLQKKRYDFRLTQSPQTAFLGSQRAATRVIRANYFAAIARSVNDLGLKVVNYCTALETLFSTDSAELTHKVSQRTAVFIGGSTEEKVAVYDVVKKAYGIRSKVVHGSGLPNDTAQQIPSTSRELDDLVRRILVKILSSEDIVLRFEAETGEMERSFLYDSLS